MPDEPTDQPAHEPEMAETGGPPASAAEPGGWYVDGGVRLNAPLKPALSLDADAVMIVASSPFVDRAPEVPHTARVKAPDVDDVLVRIMDAALVDRMVEDVRTLAKINGLVRSTGGRRASAAGGYQVVPYLAVGPAERGTLGALAAAVFDGQAAAAGSVGQWLRDPTMRLLGRLTAGDGSRRGDLLSYLFFDPEFMKESIALGMGDAEQALGGAGADEIPWQIDPIRGNDTSPE